jgi:hypothetical protein
MLDSVGFGAAAIDPNCTYRLAVLERQRAADFGLLAPTFVRIFEELRDNFNIDFDPHEAKEVGSGSDSNAGGGYSIRVLIGRKMLSSASENCFVQLARISIDVVRLRVNFNVGSLAIPYENGVM